MHHISLLTRRLSVGRLVIVGQPAGRADVKNNPSSDSGDDGWADDSAAFGGAIFFSWRAHKCIDRGVGTPEFYGKGMNAECLLPGRNRGRSRVRRKGESIVSELSVFLSGWILSQAHVGYEHLKYQML